MHCVHRLACQQFDLRLARIAKPRTTLFTAQCWRTSRSTIAVRGYPNAAFNAAHCATSAALVYRAVNFRHNTSRHDRPRPFHVAYGRSQRSMAASPMRALINHGWRSNHKFFAGCSASATTLACASLLAKVSQKALPPPLPWLAHLCLRLSAHLPWLAPSCEKATPQQRQQVPERMTQLAVATRVTGTANVIFACFAAQLNKTKGRCFTESRFLCKCFSLSSTAGNIPS